MSLFNIRQAKKWMDNYQPTSHAPALPITCLKLYFGQNLVGIYLPVGDYYFPQRGVEANLSYLYDN